MSAKRILLWSDLFWPYVGGAEIFLARLAASLRARGHHLVMVTSHDNLDLPDETEHDGLPIRRFLFRATIRRREPRQFRAVQREVVELKRRFDPDVVHVNGIGPSVFFHLRTDTTCPTLVTLQSEVLDSQTGRRDTLLYRALTSARWVVGCSETSLLQARRLLPGLETRSSVIRNSVDAVPDTPAPLPSGPPRVLCLGRLARVKGFDIALAASARLLTRFPSLRVDLAGDGAERSALERQARDLGLGDVVRFLGWIPPTQVSDLLKTATVVLMPSRREGLPLVAVQAALMARPIVATAVGGLPEIVVHGKTGILVAKDDPDAFTEAVAAMIEHPHDARMMGEAAFHYARSLLNWNDCVDAYDKLYHDLAGGAQC